MNHKNNFRSGFTIVELLIVVVVIAILAAITIVSYNGIRNQAIASSTQSTVSQNAKKLETYYIMNGDTYPVDDTTGGLTTPTGSTLGYYPSSDYKSYCLQVVNGNMTYKATNTAPNPIEGLCSTSIPSSTAVTSTTSTLSWTAVAGAGSYNTRCATDTAYTAGLKTVTATTNSANYTGLTAGTIYYCSVQALLGSATSDWSDNITMTTSAPAVPGSIASASVTVNSFVLSWAAVPGAIGYTAQCSSATTFATFVHNSSPTATSVSVTGLTGGTNYYCRVLARGTTTNSAYSATHTRATSAPATPTALTTSALTSTSFTLSWAASSGAVGYTAQCASDTGYTALIHNSSPTSVNVAVSGATAATTYYCHVLARGTSVNSAYSANLTVLTP